MEQLLKAALTRVAAPPDMWSRIQAPRPMAPRSKPSRSWVLVLAATAAFAIFQYVRPAEIAMDIQPYLQQSPDFVKTVHGESIRHVVLNDVDLFIASPRLHMRAGNARWIQFPCSKQICIAACKRCAQSSLLALVGQALPPASK